MQSSFSLSPIIFYFALCHPEMENPHFQPLSCSSFIVLCSTKRHNWIFHCKTSEFAAQNLRMKRTSKAHTTHRFATKKKKNSVERIQQPRKKECLKCVNKLYRGFPTASWWNNKKISIYYVLWYNLTVSVEASKLYIFFWTKILGLIFAAKALMCASIFFYGLIFRD